MEKINDDYYKAIKEHLMTVPQEYVVDLYIETIRKTTTIKK